MNMRAYRKRALLWGLVSLLAVGCYSGLFTGPEVAPESGLPTAAVDALLRDGYELESADKADHPEMWVSGSETSEADYEEVWCAVAKKTRGGGTYWDGLVIARQGDLWLVTGIPLDEEKDAFELVGCQVTPPMFRSIIQTI